jgi:thioredoxin-like negative regulator of GroEL
LLDRTEEGVVMAGLESRRSTTVTKYGQKPVLLFFYSETSGHSRRVEGFLAHVLQRRQNHAVFTLRRVDYDVCSELAERYAVAQPPALVVVEGTVVRARLEKPRGCTEIQSMLAPWLR